MRRFLYILGAVIVTAALGIAVVVYKGNALDAESKAFVDSAVPVIASSWSKKQLLDRATPELVEGVKPDELRALFDAYSRLGSLVEYEGANCSAKMSYHIGPPMTGSTVSASCLAKARFQNGATTFRIMLIKRDGDWMIHGFHIGLSTDVGLNDE